MNAALIGRLAAMAGVVGLVQAAVLSQLQVFGATADLLPLVVATVGLLCGSVTGAAFGFAIGLFADIAYSQVLGLTSLVFTLGGYAAGRLRELRDPQGAAVPIAVGAGATLVMALGFGLIAFLLGVDAPLSLVLLRQILLTVALNALIAVPVHLLVRRWLSGDLPDDPRRRRRRAYTTGGLSPLSSGRI